MLATVFLFQLPSDLHAFELYIDVFLFLWSSDLDKLCLFLSIFALERLDEIKFPVVDEVANYFITIDYIGIVPNVD